MNIIEIKENSTFGATSAGSIANVATSIGTTRRELGEQVPIVVRYSNDQTDLGSESGAQRIKQFMTSLCSSPEVVDVHDVRLCRDGYSALVELSDGILYDIVITSRK